MPLPPHCTTCGAEIEEEGYVPPVTLQGVPKPLCDDCEERQLKARERRHSVGCEWAQP